MNRDIINLFREVEVYFRKVTAGFVVKILEKEIVNTLLKNPIVIGYFKNVLENVEGEVDKEIADCLLQTLLKLYVRIRSHSHATSIKEKLVYIYISRTVGKKSHICEQFS